MKVEEHPFDNELHNFYDGNSSFKGNDSNEDDETDITQFEIAPTCPKLSLSSLLDSDSSYSELFFVFSGLANVECDDYDHEKCTRRNIICFLCKILYNGGPSKKG